jgi:hypothetical protein
MDGIFRMVPDYTISIEEVYEDGFVVVMLGEARGTYAPDGKLQPENRWRTPAAFRALIDAGKVAEWRVYADNEPFANAWHGTKRGGQVWTPRNHRRRSRVVSVV